MTDYQRSRSIRDALLVFFTVFIIAAISTFNMFRESRKVFEQETRDYILKIAKIAGSFVDGDLHQQIYLPEHFESPGYKQIQNPLLKILMASPDIRYLYTLVLVDDKPFFIINVQRPSDDSEPSYVMEEYVDGSPSMLDALKNKVATVEKEAYTDKWGTFLSGYAPIYNSKGDFVGIIGADVELTRYNEMVKYIQKPLIIGVITSFAFAVVIALLVFMTGTRRNINNLESDADNQ